ncbi:MAG: heparinase II/III family protein [Candidatus Sumerlaeota bacterium]|nr:heparinase II/III family protein [Candidatus Sumerlaeota bacterium]
MARASCPCSMEFHGQDAPATALKLAPFETDPEYAQKIVPAAVLSLPKALVSYEPDGAWGEGPGYWSYATHYTCFALAALQTALGTDYGLSESKGLAQAGYFPLMTAGPAGFLFNFADVGGNPRLKGIDCLFWLVRRYDKLDLADAQRAMLTRGDAATPWDVIWYFPPQKATLPLPLDKLFHGPVPVAVFHGAWNDPNAVFLAVKGGYNQVNHGHLDLGQFEFDALGQRWANDLGSDDYNLPSYFSSGETGKRWTYYRLMSESHNVPLLNGKNQNIKGKAEIAKFKSDGAGRFAIVDLTAAYSELARRVTRGVAVEPGPPGIAAGAALIQDEFELKSPCEVAWGMTTDAKIALQNETATLSRGNQQLRAVILSPAGAKFTIEPTREKPEEHSNRGFSRLMIRLPNRTGSLTVAVLLAPVWTGGKAASAPKITPLESWK